MKENQDEYIDCGMLVKLISNQLQHHFNTMLNEVNLTASQFRYLHYMQRNNGSVSFKNAQNHFQTAQPTVSGIMRRLADKQLIAVEDAAHGHAKNARLTEKGKELLAASETARENDEKLLLGALSEEEQKVFHDMLVRILHNFSLSDF
ncbi:MAG: MarR family winged helix-turn-helix transcriptional regulator [Acidaminococcus sp.]|jgi:DNA-binding MarR family transcriptional regulator|nr:MarR family winged helix-turn-helix transcriptional regulator [Acidaminococcus sp.]MCI2099779.1 MarR family winged helix-turn-helix transcriptional regulator [Acidaminococcus sp.]MCI2113951.1 MarR family winged helix-turn-helix transcriptional regulator [Acidaminococcus sp.]MCI2117092.1 MarR family winged helix-turn-helix transcriptional regulator [Acidaminococcus sp.]